MTLHSQYVLLFVVGILVSFVNAIAGGGSILSLPILTFLGLSPAVANGTNRVGILAGTFASVQGFRSHGIWNADHSKRIFIPALIGAALGSWAGIQMPESWFKPILIGVIFFVLGSMAWEERRSLKVKSDGTQVKSNPTPPKGINVFFTVLVIGFYGGVIQAGVGWLMMFSYRRLFGSSWVAVNSLKVWTTLIFMGLSLGLYGLAGKVRWDLGLALALGNGVGGYFGGVLQIRHGDRFIKRFMWLAGITVAGKLIWDLVRA